MFDIHKRRGLAPPAIGRDVLSAGLRRDHQRRRALAHRAAHPSACRDHHTMFLLIPQYLSLHFYHLFPIIKSGFKLKNY